MMHSPESLANQLSHLNLNKLAPTVLSSATGKSIENPLVTKFKSEVHKYRYSNPKEGYKNEIDNLKTKGFLLDELGNPVSDETKSARILSHLLSQIFQTTGTRITPANKIDFEQVQKLYKAIWKFSKACAMTSDRMDVNMPDFVSAALKEIGWEQIIVRRKQEKPQAVQPKAVEAVKRKDVKLIFDPKNQLLTPKGLEDKTPWKSNNARALEIAIFKTLQQLGVKLPFNPEDIISGMALPESFYPQGLKATDQKPIVWMTIAGQREEYIKDYNQLVAYLGDIKRLKSENKPMKHIAINMRIVIAKQLHPDNLRPHPGVVMAIANDMLRYLPPGTEKLLSQVRFVI